MVGLLHRFAAILLLALGTSATAWAQAVDSFDPGASYRISTGEISGVIWAIAVQPDGKVLVGGHFNWLGGGGTGTIPRLNIGRLNADGSLDMGFDPGANGTVSSIAVQADGSILVAGEFTALGGGIGTTPRHKIGRLRGDGSVDPSFDPGANNGILSVAVQPDGKILVAGEFSTLGGGGSGTTPRRGIGRLRADGSLDSSFAPPAPSNVGAIYSLAVQPDGKIVFGGFFTFLDGVPHWEIARLNSDGSLDTSFTANASLSGSPPPPSPFPITHTLAIQADQKILLGGHFTLVGTTPGSGLTRNEIARLNPNSSLDTGFNPGANFEVYALAVQADGKILVGGHFSRLGGGGTGTTTRNRIARLNADGSLDAAFDPGANGTVFALAIQADGKILIGGDFTGLGGGTGTAPRSRIGRLTNSDVVVEHLAVTDAGHVITWTRSGAGPEVWRVTFEASTDGVEYLPLGNGTRILGGWQLPGQALAIERNLYVRARGFYASRSSSIVESVINLPGTFAKVTPVFGAAGQSTSVTLNWTASAGATSYAYCYDTTDDNACATWIPVGNVLSVVPSGLQPGIRYYWQVRAIGTTEEVTEADQRTHWRFDTAAFAVTPRALVFGGSKLGASGALQYITPAQRMVLTFIGAESDWIATSDQAWLHVTAGSPGSGQFSVEVVNPENAIGGATFLTSTITVQSPTVPNGAVTIPVTLTVDQTGRSTGAAFGQVDTPIQNTIGVQGAIGVTGWALDDVGVRGVKVYRNFVGSDSPAASQIIGGHHVVYIGDAEFFAGARPDVAAAFPATPQNHRAGWGLRILTNMLPHLPTGQAHGGQGGFSLYVFAADLEGHLTLLGRDQFDHTPTVMTVNNDSIAKPFGTIDAPGSGETVGAMVANFGWALTPDTDTIAGNGDVLISPTSPQMVVFVDGAALGVVQFNQCRGTVGSPPMNGRYCDDDVANSFGNPTPQPPWTERLANPTRFRNLDVGRGAIGYYVLNTAALSNGLHAIAWSVTDSAGRTEGLGSRTFEVFNTRSLSEAPVRPSMLDARFAAAPRLVPTMAVQPLPRGRGTAWAAMSGREPIEDSFDSGLGPDEASATIEALESPPQSSVTFRTGYDLSAPFASLPVVDDGAPTVSIPELGRVELDLGGAVDRGFEQGRDGPQPLPTGASLDAARGRFTWTPPPGYLGTYRVVFVRGDERISVDIIVARRSLLAERTAW